jgi:predicted secreted Zn-dependent protease
VFIIRKSVDSVLAVFHKALADLKDVEEQHLHLAEIHTNVAQEAQVLAAEARDHADRARRVIERMSEAIR